MTSVEREIPRFPGPKFEWHQFLNEGSTGQTPIGGGPLTTLLYDYYIESIDVYAVVSGVSGEEFRIGFLPSTPPLGAIQVFFGGQISPNTGLYFPWRGLIQWHPSFNLMFDNIAGTWSCYTSGFATSSNATQP